MKRSMWIATLIALLIAGGRDLRAQPPCSEPAHDCFLKRLGPVGGWNPYGGGLLHWWPAHCFPPCGAPDDYCRKPLPRVCCSPYPPCASVLVPTLGVGTPVGTLCVPSEPRPGR